MNKVMQTVDHVTYRVTACTATGLFVGSSLATFQGLPLINTTISMASSFALVSTSCFIPERLLYHGSFYIVPKQTLVLSEADGVGNGNGDKNKDGDEDGEAINKTEKNRLFFSHVTGGLIGGGISGGLYKGRPLQGMMLLAPLMLGVAFCELKILEYRMKRIKELRCE